MVVVFLASMDCAATIKVSQCNPELLVRQCLKVLQHMFSARLSISSLIVKTRVRLALLIPSGWLWLICRVICKQV